MYISLEENISFLKDFALWNQGQKFEEKMLNKFAKIKIIFRRLLLEGFYILAFYLFLKFLHMVLTLGKSLVDSLVFIIDESSGFSSMVMAYP